MNVIKMRWTNIKGIVEALEENYPDENITNISFPKLHKRIISLLDFDDDPSTSNEQILEAIQKRWIELRQDNE
ncbi:MAG: Fe-S cluster assembly protein IscX [Rickettsiales endosymbiont of Dermacentor nuttalli]